MTPREKKKKQITNKVGQKETIYGLIPAPREEYMGEMGARKVIRIAQRKEAKDLTTQVWGKVKHPWVGKQE